MTVRTPRAEVLQEVADRIPAADVGGWLRVAVDGVDGAGKTMFADELARVLRATGRPVVRASVDAFHHRRAHRYRLGRHSWWGFWQDSFDYQRLRADLLDPLGKGGSGWYRPAVHDVVTDRELDLPPRQAPAGAVLLLDGLFLHRDELAGLWDLSVFVDVPFAVSAARMALRDGSDPNPDSPSMRRYVLAQQHYLKVCAPRQRATVVIDNTNLSCPAVLRRCR